MKEATDNALPLAIDKEEMQRVAAERIHEISREFRGGFEFLEDYPKSVTFFGASQFKEDNPYYQDARDLANKIVKELGYSVLSGGGPGIMEGANRGAYEAGGDSLGLLIQFPKGQLTNRYISASFSCYYFFVRKVLLSFSAEAFIFYPGGFGTLDEFFELVTLIQTRKVAGIPIICVGSEYWNKLKQFMVDEMIKLGAITQEEMELFQIIDDHDQIIELIKTVPVRISLPFVKQVIS